MAEIVKFSVVDTVNAKRMMGVNDEQIAYVLNLSPSQVKSVPLPKPDAPKSRAVQHLQLKKMAEALMPKVEAGDPGSINLMLKVQRREADLLGLDAPKEVITQNFNQSMPKEARELTTAELEEIVAGRFDAMKTIEGESTHD